jgi:hypothetical protein
MQRIKSLHFPIKEKESIFKIFQRIVGGFSKIPVTMAVLISSAGQTDSELIIIYY